MAQEQNKQPLGEHLVALRKLLLQTVAAIGVAAHECGHAIQHHTDYLP